MIHRRFFCTFLAFSILLAVVLLPSLSHALVTTKVPVYGVDTSDNKFAISSVQTSNDIRDSYAAPSSAYDESKYQQYEFDFKLCSSAIITSVAVTVEWQVKKTPNAKIEVFNRTGGYTNYNLSASTGTNGEVTDTIVVNTAGWTSEDINKLKVRFLASGGTAPAVDHVYVTVTYSDSGLCISPDYTEFKFPGTISYAHRISNGAGTNVTASLSALSSNGWTTRIYRDLDMNGVKDTGSPVISSISVPANGFTGIVVEIVMPNGFAGIDTTTVTATGLANVSTAKDVSATHVDGIKEAEYSAPYASYRFFDYGPDPNMASGELYSYVKNDIMYIYYAQNPRNINDNTYGINSHEGWGGGHTWYQLVESDKTEFIFLDEGGNIKLSFFSDYVGTVTPSAQYPSGYHSHGFVKALPEADGEILINATGKTDDDLAKLISIESSGAYNMNRFYSSAAGRPQVVCGTTTVNLLNDSPTMDKKYYTIDTLCPNAADYQMAYAIELAIPVAKIFPNEPVIDIVARAHNSPSKTSCRDCPPIIAEASIGDYVWYDWNGDGIQDSWENGIPNVRVVLYWDRNGDGIFSTKEQLIETRTDGNGYYLFKGLYGGNFIDNLGNPAYSGDYKVVIDATTIPSGFAPTTPRTVNPNEYILAGNPLVANRDRTITLGVTEDFRGADFGYKPTGGMIGDFVWADCNNNGVQNNGELGIANVSVELECVSLTPPVNPGLPFSCPGVIATTTTNAQGRYYFSGYSFTPSIPDGLPAGTYRVRVKASNFLSGGPLEGYILSTGPDTQPNPTYDISLLSKGIYLNADFGFHLQSATCGSIGNAVYFNADCTAFRGENPPPYSGGDFGFSNVTLSIWKDDNNNGLRDHTDTYLGSTVTDSNGQYLFTGLPVSASGINYIVQVTDNFNVLSGFDKWYPRAGLTARLTTAAREDLTVDFPYVAFGTIGDFIWNDLDRDGVQDPDEPGISGVTVRLEYFDGSWQLHSQTVTDSQGKYTFAGLRTTQPDGSSSQYRVTVIDASLIAAGWQRSPQACNGSTPCDPAKDSNNHAGTLTSLGGSTCTSQNDLKIDFGYFNPAAVTGSIGDYIWLDVNGNGLQDLSETGFNGVTLELRDAATSNVLLATTTSNSPSTGKAGWYTFAGLAVSGSYKVVVTDINGVLNGYIMTTNPDVLNVSLPDIARDPSTQGRHVKDADAGYMPIPTSVRISSFSAYSDNGRVVIEWKTSSETNTAGYYLLRQDENTGKFQKINKLIVPSLIGSSQGGTYRVVDKGARPGGQYTYKILEMETRGAKFYYGPFSVVVTSANDGPSLGTGVSFSSEPHDISAAKKARISAAKESRKAADSLKQVRKGNKIKISVVEEGMYYVDAARISEITGVDISTVRSLIRNYRFSLTNKWNEVAYMAANDGSGIYFYGRGIDSVYTTENIYWLSRGRGISFSSLTGQGPEEPVSTDKTFVETIHAEEDLVDMPAWASDPHSDYWYWNYIFSGFPGMDTNIFTIRVHGVANSNAMASMKVHLRGITDLAPGSDHHVVVSLNGTVIGQSSWDGTDHHTVTLSFNQSLLAEGNNNVQVVGLLDSGVPYGIILIDSIDLAYARYYKAKDDSLLLLSNNNNIVHVNGFTDPDIMVFDITDPEKPVSVLAKTITSSTEGYAVSFAPSSPAAVYFALTPSAVKSASKVWAYIPANLKGKNKWVNYLIITTDEFLESVKPLSDLRISTGLKTFVVTIESIFDEFSYGIYDPNSLRNFIAYAYGDWKGVLKYVVLVGEGTYDYKNIYGFEDNFVPAMMVPTPDGLYPSDGFLADVNGDHVPEVPIGRLPVVNSQELANIINKIWQYENSQGGQWTKSILLTADDPDPDAGDFPVDSDTLAALIPPHYSVEKIYLSDRPLHVARQTLLDKLASGALILNYIGHGTLDQLAFEGLFTNNDVDLLTNGTRLPVTIAMTCFMNNFAYPGFDTLGEALLLKNNGGSVGVWGPAGLSLNAEALILNRKIYEHIFVDKIKVLGKAVRKAMESYQNSGGKPFMLDIYNLLGDPALRIK